MSENKKNFEIVSEIAQIIASENEDSSTESDTDNSSVNDKNNGLSVESTDNAKKSDKPYKGKHKSKQNKATPTLKELAIKKQSQNLAERKILLVILAVLLGIQLLFMNAVVALIVLWSSFDWDFFRELDPEILKHILDFTKYYVTAVLVELLGGIIYIVHRVFSNKN